ncbi:protein takeout-like [Periplaneta americana]|uniref:protein takeout-like n=1 Tax=Periplaneta americana TaxID=6978 RepID=UPI0037E749B4
MSVDIAKVLALSLTLASIVRSDKLPSTFPQCKRNDPEIDSCLQSAFEISMKAMKDGIPSFRLLPVDPLTVTKISVHEGEGRPVNLNLDLIDTKLHGLSAVKITSTKSDLDNKHVKADALLPEIILHTNYVMDGKFLLLALKGEGKATANLTDVEVQMDLKAEPQKIDGETHWNVTVFTVNLVNTNHFNVNFDNLFNGDKVLGETTNKIINDNGREFFEELRPAIEETLGSIFRNIANTILSKVSEKEMFS